MAALAQHGYDILGGDNAEQEIVAIADKTCDDEDPNYLKYVTVMMEAQYECAKCSLKWPSQTATIKIDLMRCCISKKYRQRCKRCGNHWALPRIRSDKFKSVVKEITRHIWNTQNFQNAGRLPAVYSKPEGEPPTPDHSVGYCERCIELGGPCYLQGTKISKLQRRLDCSSATSIFKQLPRGTASYIQKHMHLLTQILEEMWVKIEVHVDDQSAFVHILPTRKSRSIKDWNKTCESKLNTFLKSLESHSLLLQPELLPRLQEVIKEVKSNASLCVEEQTVYQIVGECEEVKTTLENIQHIQKKPCIIPF